MRAHVHAVANSATMPQTARRKGSDVGLAYSASRPASNTGLISLYVKLLKSNTAAKLVRCSVEHTTYCSCALAVVATPVDVTPRTCHDRVASDQ